RGDGEGGLHAGAAPDPDDEIDMVGGGGEGAFDDGRDEVAALNLFEGFAEGVELADGGGVHEFGVDFGPLVGEGLADGRQGERPEGGVGQVGDEGCGPLDGAEHLDGDAVGFGVDGETFA